MKMTAEEVRKMIDAEFGFKVIGNCDDGTGHRVWWISTAIELGDYSIDELMQALRETRHIKDVRQRVYEVHRRLEAERIKRMFAKA